MARERATRVEATRWPRCVICGRADRGDKSYIASMYELAPGVKSGVVHKACFQKVEARRRKG